MGVNKMEDIFEMKIDWQYVYKVVINKIHQLQKGFNIELFIGSPEELQNEVYIYHIDLLRNYKPNKSSIVTWLGNTLPARLIREYGYQYNEIHEETEMEEFIHIEGNEEDIVRLLHMDFNRAYFLSEQQREIGDCYFNQYLSIKQIHSLLGYSEEHIRVSIDRIRRNIKEVLSCPVHFFFYCAVPSELENMILYYTSMQRKEEVTLQNFIDILSINQQIVVHSLFIEGLSKTETQEQTGLSNITINRNLKKVIEKFKGLIEVELAECLLDTLQVNCYGVNKSF